MSKVSSLKTRVEVGELCTRSYPGSVGDRLFVCNGIYTRTQQLATLNTACIPICTGEDDYLLV